MIIAADARHVPLRDGCVQCVVTSPPYFGLRDYGITQQIGLEQTPDAYVAALVGVFRELRRVLRDDGTVWLNLGDSYSALTAGGIKPKDLIGIPWRVAFALQSDGWYLRSDIIWSKPNPMPESATDRPTNAHEYIFLLSKSPRYYYDADAIREPSPPSTIERNKYGRIRADNKWFKGGAQTGGQSGEMMPNPSGRNKRSVWTVNTMPYAWAHFATMPEALVEPCILAGCPIGGLVYDPFLGSGTVGAVAERLGRQWVGTDLAYHDLSTTRTRQQGLRWS